MPAISPTVWLPVLRVSSPVEPPSPTLVASASVVPSIWRLNLPGSVDGLSDFLTSSLPVSRVFVITQTMSESGRDGNRQRSAVVTGRAGHHAPVPLSSLHSIDFW